jgi:hypothetical protein
MLVHRFTPATARSVTSRGAMGVGASGHEVSKRPYLDDFVAKTDPDKLASILAKIWNKMSPLGRDAALKLALPPAIPALLEQGLARFRANR